MTVIGVWSALEKAAADPHIKAVVLEPEGISAGWAKLQELRLDIDKFRKSGKPVFAYLRQPGTREYYVASGADRIYLGPSEPVMLKGLRAEMMYFKKTLDKLGVSVEIEHAGKYKDFGDMFTRSDMSPETREVMTSVVDDLYSDLVTGIADGTQEDAGGSARHHRSGSIHGAAGTEGRAGGRASLRRPDVGRTERPPQDAASPRKVSMDKYSKVTAESVGLQGKSQIALVVGAGDIVRGDAERRRRRREQPDLLRLQQDTPPRGERFPGEGRGGADRFARAARSRPPMRSGAR